MHLPSVGAGGNIVLPQIPQTFPPIPTATTEANFLAGSAFYLPPESYVDPSHVSGSPQSLNSGETCSIYFTLGVLAQGAQSLTVNGRSPFILRRPPLVLVHGIMSGPSTWDSILYSEMPGSPVPTRQYYVDYSATSAQGYSENFSFVANSIQQALVEYRNAADGSHNPNRGFGGVRYAATRADVVAHSQGGQLARFYISGLEGWASRGGAWGVASFARSPQSVDGHLPYIRPDNWGAGSIRRLVTLGSPFKGSPLANTVEPWLQPTAANVQLIATVRELDLIPAGLDAYLFGPADDYIPSTCAADLAVGSALQTLLEQGGLPYGGGLDTSAWYPSSHRTTRFFPLVGIATNEPGTAQSEAILWELLFRFAPFIPDPEDPFSLSPLNATTSDLIVPHCSQRNLAGECGSPADPTLPGMFFPTTAHSSIGIVDGETESTPMALEIGRLLSVKPSPFQTNWSIGP